MTEREQPHDDYWTHDEQIAEVRLWRDERYSLRLKAHIADEIYRQGKSEEIIPLKEQRGVRTYVHAKPYVLVPDVTVSADIYPAPDPTGAAGEVSSSTWEGMRHEELGNCQAWFYVEDRSIVLWESFLHDRYRGQNPLDDANSYALWEGFERFLAGRFPSAQLIATTHDDPLYETAQYQQFLRSMGYQPLTAAAFGKQLSARTNT
jgi:hypothetical protein